jgi:HK97 family phage prohead protease
VSELERRFTPGMVEVRAADDKNRIGGYGAVFNKLSRNLGGFVEVVRSGAFNGSRAAGWPNVVARYNHDNNALLGTTAGRTLDLRVDDNVGLWYDVEPPQSRADILDLVRRGDIRYSSFAFRRMPKGDHWTTSDQGYPLCELHEVQLVDVAPVVDPAYPDATAQARALSAALESLASHVGAAVEEVRSMAEADELRRFFVRTDTPSTKTPAKRIFGPAAAAARRARQQDPWA